MKTRLLLVLAIISYFFSYSQTTFQDGYFIANNGDKTDCLIKNKDWRDNPSDFEYKTSEDSKVLVGSIYSVKEFGISDIIKYERHQVKIDRSSDRTNELKAVSRPIFEEESLFLKVLVQGDAQLFGYENKAIRRFFFGKAGQNIEPLIYKRFLGNGNKIGTNAQYKQQLLSLNCDGISPEMVDRLRYVEDDLIDYFEKYSQCSGQDFEVYKDDSDKLDATFNASVLIGASHASLSISNNTWDFEGKYFLMLGGEFEVILPFNNNKWSVFIAPTYQSYSSETVSTERLSFLNPDARSNIDYNTVEAPLGLRHYIFLSDKSKLFINASFAFVFDVGSEITFEPSVGIFRDLKISGTEEYFSGGFGYNYNDKIRLEFRFNTKRDLFGDDMDVTSEYNKNYALILGYSFL